MELPQPPQGLLRSNQWATCTLVFTGSLDSQSILQLFSDQDLRNIIDKLAQFVARNGPEFEKMTKNKQKNNPKFSFLYGGEYFNYYQYKVTTEQASKHKLKMAEIECERSPPIAGCS